jgi:hypothetical protein
LSVTEKPARPTAHSHATFRAAPSRSERGPQKSHANRFVGSREGPDTWRPST